MHARCILVRLSIVLVIASGIVVAGCSSTLNIASDDELQAQMHQDIIHTLREIVVLREELLKQAQAKQQATASGELDAQEAQLRLSEARLQLAVAEHQPEVAMEAFRDVLAIHKIQLEAIAARAQAGMVGNGDVAEAKLQLLEKRVYLATTIQAMSCCMGDRSGQ